MSFFAERRRVELAQKIASLEVEFRAWRKASAEKQFYEKHQSQIAAVSGQLCGLRARVAEEFATLAKADGQLLAEARNLEAMVLAVRRIWEFFRAKWVQRRESAFSLYLRAADELAWSCYRPVREYLAEGLGARRHEPPLVFLNGGTSPFSLARDQAFEPEPVAQEFLNDRELKSVLDHLPVPVIGVPWFHLAHFAETTVVAHETGHAVERDFALLDGLLANVELVVPQARRAAWTAWMREAFADLFACLTMGPAFAGTLVELLAVDRESIAGEQPNENGKYPPVRVRVALCVAALFLTGFEQDATTLLRRWCRAYGAQHRSPFERDARAVARAVICQPAAPLAVALHAIPGLRVTGSPGDWDDAATGMKQRLASPQPGPPNAVSNIRSFFILARMLYDADPAAYFAADQTNALLGYLPSIIQPGVRAGEERLSAPALEQLAADHERSGKAWFDEIRELVIPTTRPDLRAEAVGAPPT